MGQVEKGRIQPSFLPSINHHFYPSPLLPTSTPTHFNLLSCEFISSLSEGGRRLVAMSFADFSSLFPPPPPCRMDTVKAAVNYVSETVQGVGAEASKEANSMFPSLTARDGSRSLDQRESTAELTSIFLPPLLLFLSLPFFRGGRQGLQRFHRNSIRCCYLRCRR